MIIDKSKLREVINSLFHNYRIDITEFDSGAVMIDIFRSEGFIVIQYDGESYIGVSVIPDNDVAAGFGLPDKVFYTIEDFEDYLKKIQK